MTGIQKNCIARITPLAQEKLFLE